MSQPGVRDAYQTLVAAYRAFGRVVAPYVADQAERDDAGRYPRAIAEHAALAAMRRAEGRAWRLISPGYDGEDADTEAPDTGEGTDSPARVDGPHWHTASTTVEEIRAGIRTEESVRTSRDQYSTAAGAMNIGAIARWRAANLTDFASFYSLAAVDADGPAVMLRASSDRARNEDGEPDVLIWPLSCPGCTSTDAWGNGPVVAHSGPYSGDTGEDGPTDGEDSGAALDDADDARYRAWYAATVADTGEDSGEGTGEPGPVDADTDTGEDTDRYGSSECPGCGRVGWLAPGAVCVCCEDSDTGEGTDTYAERVAALIADDPFRDVKLAVETDADTAPAARRCAWYACRASFRPAYPGVTFCPACVARMADTPDSIPGLWFCDCGKLFRGPATQTRCPGCEDAGAAIEDTSTVAHSGPYSDQTAAQVSTVQNGPTMAVRPYSGEYEYVRVSGSTADSPDADTDSGEDTDADDDTAPADTEDTADTDGPGTFTLTVTVEYVEGQHTDDAVDRVFAALSTVSPCMQLDSIVRE